jgi:hypothetical protein
MGPTEAALIHPRFHSREQPPARESNGQQQYKLTARPTFGPRATPDNETAFRVLAKIGMLEVVKTETFPAEKLDVFFKALV